MIIAKRPAVVVFFILLAFCASCYQRNSVETLFGDPLETAGASRRHVFKNRGEIISIFRMGKETIPLLIERIEDYRPLGNLARDPMSSHLEKEDFDQPLGFLAAYLIELILAVDSIDGKAVKTSPWLFGRDEDYYVTGYGAIYKDHTGYPDGIRASAADLAMIKLNYELWWANNRLRELAELRLDWKRGIRPLSGSPYEWQ